MAGFGALSKFNKGAKTARLLFGKSWALMFLNPENQKKRTGKISNDGNANLVRFYFCQLTDQSAELSVTDSFTFPPSFGHP